MDYPKGWIAKPQQGYENIGQDTVQFDYEFDDEVLTLELDWDTANDGDECVGWYWYIYEIYNPEGKVITQEFDIQKIEASLRAGVDLPDDAPSWLII